MTQKRPVLIAALTCRMAAVLPKWIVGILSAFLTLTLLAAGTHALNLEESVTIFPDPPAQWKVFAASLTVSPNSAILACVAKNGDRMTVFENGRPLPAFERIGRGTPVYSPDSAAMAFTGFKDGLWHMVIDGTVQPGYAAVSDPRFGAAGGPPAFIIQDASGQAVVWKGEKGPYFQGIAFQPDQFVISPNSMHLAYVGAGDKGMCLVADNTPGPAFKAVAHPVFSPDSTRLVCTVQQDGQWHVLENGNLGPGFDAVAGLLYSPNSKHLAYLATKGQKMCLIKDHNKEAFFDAVASPVFSTDSRRLAYVAVQKMGETLTWSVVIDGTKGKAGDRIGAFEFSLDSRRTAYSVQKDGAWHMVVDEKPGPGFALVSIPVFSPDSNSVAYAAKMNAAEGDRWVVVVDGKAGPAFDSVSLPFFSPDGKCTGYMAQRDGKWRIVSDGVEGPVFDGVSMPTFSPDSRHLACLIQRGPVWSVAVDGKPGQTLFRGALKGARLVFDDNPRFHTLVMGVQEGAFARLDVTIATETP